MGVGGVAVVCYLVGLLPKVGNYVPTLLMDGNSLIYGMKDVGDYICALVIVIVTGTACLVVSIAVLNKKKI